MSKTICIDFDGCVHACSKGWQDGSIYDYPVPGALEAITHLLQTGHIVFILSTRSPRQIRRWFDEILYHEGKFESAGYIMPFDYQVVPFWKKFWDKPGVVGITGRKLPATVYIDDRAVRFDGSWQKVVPVVKGFRTYAEAIQN